jgi:hypothetical protein
MDKTCSTYRGDYKCIAYVTVIGKSVGKRPLGEIYE